MTFKLGLTGSIGMGKTTTAQIFRDLGCAVWDADAEVHRMYSIGGKAVAPICALLPDAIVDGAVSRDQLKRIITDDPAILHQIEAIVHPLVALGRKEFLQECQQDIAVFDIPLLFETGGDASMDAVACVTVAPEIQRQRVLDRGTMTEAQFQSILAKQMPIEEKLARSDFVIETDTPKHARAQVEDIVKSIRDRLTHA